MSREEVLGRIREALEIPSAEVGPAPVAGKPAVGDAELFAARVSDYRAEVTRCAAEDDVRDAISARLAAHGAARVVVPSGFPDAWRPDGLSSLSDAPPLTHAELDAADAVLTTATSAIAESGTLVLDGAPGQGRRALTLLPDLHVCVVRAADVVATVADALAVLGDRAGRAPITFVSGPSATSDIELDRVEGVHGPRRLEVLLVD